MYNIGVIGDKQSILGFKAVGLNVFDCSSSDEAKHTLHKMAKGDFAIIYITESIYKQIEDDINQYKNSRLPAIIPIPGMDGKLGIGVRNIKKAVERAVGSDILFGGN